MKIVFAPVSKVQADIERAFAGSVLSLPLIPSMFALVIATTSSFILNLTDTSTCSDFLFNFVSINIGLSYFFVIIYGFILVGPKMEQIIGTLMIYLLYFLFVLAEMLWATNLLYEDSSNSTCFKSPIWILSLIILIIFYVHLIGFILFLFSVAIMRCIRTESDLEVAVKEETELVKLEREQAELESKLKELDSIESKKLELDKLKKSVQKQITVEKIAMKRKAEEEKRKASEEFKKQEKEKAEQKAREEAEQRRQAEQKIQDDIAAKEMRELEEQLEIKRKLIEAKKSS